MKNLSKVMYIIARIFNILEIILFAVLLVVLGIVPLVAGLQLEDTDAKITAIATAGTMIALFAVLLLVAIVVGILLMKAYKSLGTAEKRKHILMIVLGVLSENIFLVLGGIFGTVSAISRS